jgi:hypothetical protein
MMKGSPRTALIILLLVTLPMAAGSGRRDGGEIEYTVPSVTLTLLSERPITIGDPIDLALAVVHERRDEVVFPEGDEAFAPVVLRELSVKKRKIGSGTMKTMVLYTVAAYQTGTVGIPALDVMVGDTPLSTEPLSISILSVLPAEESERDLKDIVSPYRARIRTLTVIIILCGIAAAFAAYLVLRRYLIRPRQAPKTILESDTSFDPFASSLRELEHIREEHQRDVADSKRVYTTISHSLRLFFGSLLSIQALEMTTAEIKRFMRRSRTRYVQPTRLINILNRSDLVKFAKADPAHQSVEQDIDQSISIIKEAHDRMIGVETKTKTETAAEGVSENGV